MGTRNIARGLALFITAATPIGNFPDSLQFLGSEDIYGFPISFIIVIAFFIGFHIFLKYTPLGRKIYCVGGNAEAAKLAGINSDRVLIFVYALSGLMCAIAGILLVGRVNSAFPLAGETYDMDAIASCIVGGASFSGGKGTISYIHINPTISKVVYIEKKVSKWTPFY